jgi:hypothetical protein
MQAVARKREASRQRTVGAGWLSTDVEQHAIAVVGRAIVREPRRSDADTSAERARRRLLDTAPRDLGAAQRSPLAGKRAIECGKLRVGDQRCQIGALDVREPRQSSTLLCRPPRIASKRQEAIAQRHTRHIHCQGGGVLLHIGAESIEQHDGARLVAVNQRVKRSAAHVGDHQRPGALLGAAMAHCSNAVAHRFGATSGERLHRNWRVGERTHGRRHRDTALAASVCRAALLCARTTRRAADARHGGSYLHRLSLRGAQCAQRAGERDHTCRRRLFARLQQRRNARTEHLHRFDNELERELGVGARASDIFEIIENERHSDALLLLGAHRAKRRNEHIEQPMHETELERLRVQRAERPIVERAQPLGSNSALIEHNTPQNIARRARRQHVNQLVVALAPHKRSAARVSKSHKLTLGQRAPRNHDKCLFRRVQFQSHKHHCTALCNQRRALRVHSGVKTRQTCVRFVEWPRRCADHGRINAIRHTPRLKRVHVALERKAGNLAHANNGFSNCRRLNEKQFACARRQQQRGAAGRRFGEHMPQRRSGGGGGGKCGGGR